MFKPELLLPSGNIESFFAAIDGGADAVYLGLKKFNARNRAKNFSYTDLYNITNEAHNKSKKVYVTLNTLLKNEELSELIEMLGVLSQSNIDALIIQDFAVLNLVNKYFKSLKIHASTQMAVHNSIGCDFFEKQGFERIILSREISSNELNRISKISHVQKEIFVHGALCYSFSGHCMFSSYLGGNSANRGLCAQVCRRNFLSNNTKTTFFSLKDFQLIELIPIFSELKISSLKIEGRMKSPEYIYNTARAYRMVIDDHSKMDEAKEILKYDFAREKTSWFMGGNVKESITSNTGTGILIGKINSIFENGFTIQTDIIIDKYSKLRYRAIADKEAEFIKIENISKTSNIYSIYCDVVKLSKGIEIYLAGTNNIDIRTKFLDLKQKKFNIIGQRQNEQIKKSFKISNIKALKQKLFIRISKLDDLNKFKHSDFEAIYLKFRFSDLEKLMSANISQLLKQKIHIELPKYISELRLVHLKNIIKKLVGQKYNNFVISHISQIDLLSESVNISSNENVYILNDISANFIQSKGIKNYCYPLENDYPNMLKGQDRNGIIPIYFYPELFYSRMPVKIGESLKDESGKQYKKLKFNGFTIIIDKNPVSLTQNINKFAGKGFYKFLIDLSYEPNIQSISKILSAIKKSEKIQGTSDFNIKKGLH